MSRQYGTSLVDFSRVNLRLKDSSGCEMFQHSLLFLEAVQDSERDVSLVPVQPGLRENVLLITS